VSNGSDGVEQVAFAIAQASNEQSNCVLNLATRPSKHPLQFQFSESKM
jgi:hypothetical protein